MAKQDGTKKRRTKQNNRAPDNKPDNKTGIKPDNKPGHKMPPLKPGRRKKSAGHRKGTSLHTDNTRAPDGTKFKLRKCAVSADMKPTSEMIRFVLGPDDRVVADIKQRLPGRGVWVTSDRHHLQQAAKTNVFARAFKRNVKLDKSAQNATLADTVAVLIEQKSLGLLSLANKAGMVIFGFENIAAAIAKEHLCALLHAREAAPDGCQKLDRKLHGALKRARGEDAVLKNEAPETLENAAKQPISAPALLQIHSVANLSMALGRPNVVHAAIKQSGVGQNYLRTARKLHQLRASSSPDQVQSRTTTAGDKASSE